MTAKNKHIVVLGAGESGTAVALLAKKKGFSVFLSDAGEIKENYKNELITNGIEWEEKGHTFSRISVADEVVKSPGISNESELIQKLKEKGIIPIGEIEFAARFTDAKFIAITGSNGKTTTTDMIYHVLSEGGVSVEVAGNIGISLARRLLQDKKVDYYVVELSSFQLEDMYDFKSHISILLNITPDHLDRYHDDIEEYGLTKMRIANNQNADDYFIFNQDDENILRLLKTLPIQAKKMSFSLKDQTVEGFYNKEKQTINIKNNFNMSIHDLALKGMHNVQNSLAAGITARLLDIRKESIRNSLSDYKGIEHRLEFVAKVNGIEFINDSKATNVNATWYALESMQNPTVWIVGGIDKGNNYEELIPLVKEKVKAIICLGVNNEKIIEAFSGVVENIIEVRSAMEAVGYGYQLANQDETVLLSPACASFDLFENYEDRGMQFKKAVRLL